ncbi:MalM family protein [Aeromonas media]|uniref:MalM family protein n=1 Tax=Aeromonas media TaxID=651 RepID=UPI00370B25F6
MKQKLFFLTVVGGLVMGGCSSFEAQVAPTQQYKSVVSNRDAAVSALSSASECCRDLSALPYKELPVSTGQVVPIDTSSPVYRFEEGKSYFAAYHLPVNSGDLRITVEGIVDHTLFNPIALMLDSRHRVTRKLGPETFKYEPARFMNGDRMEAVFTVDRSQVGNPNNESYLVIYTDESKLGGTTTVMSQTKLMAKSMSVVDYGAKDPVVPHSPWGVVRLSVEDLSGKQTSSNYYKPTYDAPIPPPAPAVEATPNKLMVAPVVASGVTSTATAAPMLSETETFYSSQIEKAVKAGDIDKAMQLVNEAERAGSTKAKSVFIDAIKRSQKN